MGAGSQLGIHSSLIVCFFQRTDIRSTFRNRKKRAAATSLAFRPVLLRLMSQLAGAITCSRKHFLPKRAATPAEAFGLRWLRNWLALLHGPGHSSIQELVEHLCKK